jgi:hypothetical protein
LKDDGILTVSETESKITNLLVQMHEETKIILEKNSIIQNEKSRIENNSIGSLKASIFRVEWSRSRTKKKESIK